MLNKLLEDGNVLYRKSRLREAAHRYSYALSKFPPVQELDSTFKQLRLNFLLNYSRCKRKMNVSIENPRLEKSDMVHKVNFFITLFFYNRNRKALLIWQPKFWKRDQTPTKRITREPKLVWTCSKYSSTVMKSWVHLDRKLNHWWSKFWARRLGESNWALNTRAVGILEKWWICEIESDFRSCE